MATYLDDLEAAIDAELEALQSKLEGGDAAESQHPGLFSLSGKESTEPDQSQPNFYDLMRKKPAAAGTETPELTESERKSRGGASTRGTPRPRIPVPTEIRALSARIDRLDQLKTWMHDDPDLFHILDLTIGNQVKAAEERQSDLAKAAERRQRVYSFVGAIITLIVGWLLSLVGTPAMLAHLIGR
jgi:hypothetical protein